MFPAVCCLLLFIATSLGTPENFKYIKENNPDFYNGFTKSTCKTCLQDQCLDNAPGCEYYAETSAILADDDDEGDDVGDDELRMLVDEAVGDVMETAGSDESLMECVPLFSKKTDCTKENICIGCTTCHCGVGGVWNCSQVQQCRSDGLRVDFIMLDRVISILNKTDVCLKLHFSNERSRRVTEIEYPHHDVYKRDTATETANETKSVEPKLNTGKSIEEFKEHVLQPINNIIDEKRNELNEIIKIKDNLINLIKTCKNKDIDLNITTPTNHSRGYFTIYKLQFEPHHDILRSNNETLLNKYLNKLKADIHTVLRDVLGIHKLTKTKLPKDLIKLIRALNYYLVKNVKNRLKQKEVKATIAGNQTSLRRYTHGCYIQENVLRILKSLINTTKPSLSVFTQKTKIIIKRIVNQVYSSDSENHNPNVNNADVLPTIAQNMELYIQKMDSSKDSEKLYAMKNLHLQLTTSINTMTAMLERVNFALYRRMVNVDQTDTFESLLNIDETLKNIRTKLKYYENNPKMKINFLSRLMNFLKKSKKGVAKLFSRNKLKVSNKLNVTDNNEDDIKEMLEELVKRRANHSPRYKRSLGYSRSRYQNRMKNIILPKYLRRKMSPAIEESVNKRISKYNEARKEKNLKEAMEQQSREENRKLKIIEKANLMTIREKDKTNPKRQDAAQLHTRLAFVKN